MERTCSLYMTTTTVFTDVSLCTVAGLFHFPLRLTVTQSSLTPSRVHVPSHLVLPSRPVLSSARFIIPSFQQLLSSFLFPLVFSCAWSWTIPALSFSQPLQSVPRLLPPRSNVCEVPVASHTLPIALSSSQLLLTSTFHLSLILHRFHSRRVRSGKNFSASTVHWIL